MNIQQKFEEFEQVYQQSIEEINNLLSDPDVGYIAKWLMETDINPYSFLPNGWGPGLNNSIGFVSLLRTIHHAIVDDGDISFPVVNGWPRISFMFRYDVSDNNCDFKREQENACNFSLDDVKWLKDFKEFIVALELKEADDIKHYIKLDMRDSTKADIIKEYGDSKYFDLKWFNENYPN